MEVSGQLHIPAAFTTREKSPVLTGSEAVVSPTAGLDTVAKRKNPCP